MKSNIRCRKSSPDQKIKKTLAVSHFKEPFFYTAVLVNPLRVYVSAIRGVRESTKRRRRRWQRQRQQSNRKRFNEKTDNSLRTSHFLVHFLTVLYDNDVKIPNATFYGGSKHHEMRSFPSFLNLNRDFDN